MGSRMFCAFAYVFFVSFFFWYLGDQLRVRLVGDRVGYENAMNFLETELRLKNKKKT
jgi:hypothetical protein